MGQYNELKKRYRKLYSELELIEIIRGVTRAEMKMIFEYLTKQNKHEKKKQKIQK